MKKINKLNVFLLVSFSFLTLAILNNKEKDFVSANAEEEMITEHADVTKFGLVFNAHHTTNLVIDAENQTMTTNGA